MNPVDTFNIYIVRNSLLHISISIGHYTVFIHIPQAADNPIRPLKHNMPFPGPNIDDKHNPKLGLAILIPSACLVCLKNLIMFQEPYCKGRKKGL